MGRLFKIPPFEFSGNATVPVRIIDDSQVANKICCSLSSYAPQSGSGLAVTAKSHGLHGLKHRSRGQSPNLSSIRSEEHTSELQSLMRISYAVFCLKTKTIYTHQTH